MYYKTNRTFLLQCLKILFTNKLWFKENTFSHENEAYTDRQTRPPVISKHFLQASEHCGLKIWLYRRTVIWHSV